MTMLIDTDRLAEIVTYHAYGTEAIVLMDLDSWSTGDIQEAMDILETALIAAFNQEMDSE